MVSGTQTTNISSPNWGDSMNHSNVSTLTPSKFAEQTLTFKVVSGLLLMVGLSACSGGGGGGGGGSDSAASVPGASFFPTGPALSVGGMSGIPIATTVALSGDGSTMAVGVRGDDSNLGAVQVYFRSAGSGWVPEGAKLIGSDAGSAARQGSALALSLDGSTLAVGAPVDAGGLGAVLIYTRSGSTWTQQGAKLLPTGFIGGAGFGSGVALSSDGNTLVVGGNRDNTDVGAAWIFVRSGSTWTGQGSKLVGSGSSGQSGQGTSVSISGDGNTVAVGGPNDGGLIGATWIFTRSGSSWSQFGSKLVGSGAGSGMTFQGTSVSLSADGATLAVGGPYDSASFLGAVWVFARNGASWAQQGSKLARTGTAVGGRFQGNSVALSANGNLLAVGAPSNVASNGGVWIYTRVGGSWLPIGSSALQGTLSTGLQGGSVALSHSGGILAVGASYGSAVTPEVWTYAQ